MFNKIPSNKKPQKLTKSIVDKIYQILNETFEHNLDNTCYEFYIYGEVFEKETLVIISLINKESDLESISCFLSCDQTEIKKDNDIDQLINFYGEIFEEISNNNFENIEFSSQWQMHHKNKRNSYHLSRENIILSLKANELLKD